MPQNRTASATVYLVEELGDAQLLCEQLIRQVARATEMVEKSTYRDHIFEVAGDLVQGFPETLNKLKTSLNAVALATNTVDSEEVKGLLPPSKVEELESVLKDVAVRPVSRRGTPMNSVTAKQRLEEISNHVCAFGALPAADTLAFIHDLEAGLVTASESELDLASELEKVAGLFNAPGVSRARLVEALRPIVAKASETNVLNALQKALEDILIEAKKKNEEDIEELAAKALKHLKVASISEGEKVAADIEAPTEDVINTLEKITDSTENFLKEMKHSLGKLKENPGKNAPQLKNFKDAVWGVAGLTRMFDRKVKVAGDPSKADWEKALAYDEKCLKNTEAVVKDLEDGKTVGSWTLESAKNSVKGLKAVIENKKALLKNMKFARFEEGKPADPTENMSQEDAKVWEDMNEEHGDNFKEASFQRFEAPDYYKQTENTVNSLLEARVSLRKTADQLNAFYNNATNTDWYGDLGYYGNDRVKKLRDSARELDSDIGEVFRNLEYFATDVKKAVSKAPERTASAFSWKVAGDDEDEGCEEEDCCGDCYDKSAAREEKVTRYKEGEPADPTENMSEEDAKEWKDNTEEHKDNFKAASAGTPEEQLKAMKAHSPRKTEKGDMFVIEVYSTVVKKYIPMFESTSEAAADADLKVWATDHQRLLKALKAKSAEQAEETEKTAASLYSQITPKALVTIVDGRGNKVKGRATMKGPAGWVLNMGGPNGRPAIATPDNVVMVKAASWEPEHLASWKADES